MRNDIADPDEQICFKSKLIDMHRQFIAFYVNFAQVFDQAFIRGVVLHDFEAAHDLFAEFRANFFIRHNTMCPRGAVRKLIASSGMPASFR